MWLGWRGLSGNLPGVAALLALVAASGVAGQVPPLHESDSQESRAPDEAREHRIAIDAAHSHADFKVRVMWLFDTHGSFASLHGAVHVDEAREHVWVDARILVDSVDMDGEDKEEWVKSPEFFDAGEWPEIHFVSQGFPLSQLETGGELPGRLTVRGMTRDTTFDVLPVPCTAAGLACPIEARGVIRRSEFGMQSRRGLVSDKVRLKLSIRILGSLGTAG